MDRTWIRDVLSGVDFAWEVLLLIVGAGIALILQRWYESRPVRRQERARKRVFREYGHPFAEDHSAQTEARVKEHYDKQRDWLIQYYTDRGADGDLYRLETVEGAQRLAFFSRKTWREPSLLDRSRVVVDLDDDVALTKSDAEEDSRTLDTVNYYTRLKKESGEEWNDPLLAFAGMSEGQDGHPELSYGWASYYQFLSTCGALTLETQRAMLRGKADGPRRNSEAADLEQLSSAKLGAQAVGGRVAFAVTNPDGRTKLLLQRRKRRGLATYPGSYSVVPMFGCQPLIHGGLPRGASLDHDALREFGEELLGIPELDSSDDGFKHHKMDNYAWFYSSPNFLPILKMRSDGDLEVVRLGFGFDALNGEANVAFLYWLRAASRFDELRDAMQINEEIRSKEWIELDSNEMEERLARPDIDPGSAFAIDLARKYIAGG